MGGREQDLWRASTKVSRTAFGCLLRVISWVLVGGYLLGLGRTSEKIPRNMLGGMC